MSSSIAQEVKRKIDAKIFELQCSLLEDGVTDALLRECAIWFRPSHLQDIIIERSEAEALCGWPACRNPLHTWAKTATLVFEVPGGENSARFCGKACAAKTSIFLVSIPSTLPYTREGVLRITCPSLYETPGNNKGINADGKGSAAEPKKYKPPRRRDRPARHANGTGQSDTSIFKPENKDGSSGQSKPSTSCSAEEKDMMKLDANIANDGNTTEVHRVGPASDDTTEAPAKTKDPQSDAGLDEIVDRMNPAATHDVCVDDAVEHVPETLEATSIEGKNVSDSTSASTSEPSLPLFGQGETIQPSGTTSGSEGCAKASVEATVEHVRETLEATSIHAPDSPDTAPTPSPLPPTQENTGKPPGTTVNARGNADTAASWEGMSLNSFGKATSVSLHATMAAAVRAESGSKVGGDTRSITPPKIQKPLNLNKEKVSARKASSTSRKKGVTFAAGTKECPPSAVFPLADGIDAATGTASGTSGGDASIGKNPPRMTPASNGKRKELSTKRVKRGGKGSSPARAGHKKAVKTPSASVIGEVVERAPKLPTRMSNVPRDKAASSFIEGHLPKIEADLSFSVLPRGYKDPLGVTADGNGDTGASVNDTEDEEADSGDAVERDEDGDENNNEDDENDRFIWREDFGEEMPADVAEGSWIDMKAINDKAMREEFASSIGAFPILWGALSEWVTPETRAVCRAGRAASAKIVDSASRVSTTSGVQEEGAVTQKDTSASERVENGQASSAVCPENYVPLHARRAGAVAEAIESVAHRYAREGHGTRGSVIGNPTAHSVTVTGALRHSGVSTMVNMHLAQAASAIRAGEGINRQAVGQAPADEKSKVFTWSQGSSQGKRGLRSGAWVKNAEDSSRQMAAALVTAEIQAEPSQAKLGVRDEAAVQTARQSRRWTSDGIKEALVAVEPAGAECRRAVAALIDTFDAGRASGAAELSIAQWKIVTVVLMTAIGLGGGGEALRDENGGRNDPLRIGPDEAKAGAEACLRLCGVEVPVSEREFHLLVEALLEE